ncbi:phosphatidylinositol-glycan biosynthesis class W protein [Megalops cyprinoides]|uniref:phosphatidylinositol-glycan biosynthesis class W protein n=1 Tax=Megalops cyprinoides TaxID=118141 RepID=UPI001864EEEE|nr:phosphatidylinositol-glycan biosynthesis class W protein [Megalops cyprinoides]
MTCRELKEAFVSNLTGTSLVEVSLGSTLAPLCLISRGLVLILYHLGKGILPFPWNVHFLLDFTIVMLPLVLSCTILSDILPLVIMTLGAINISLLFCVYHRRKHGAGLPMQDVVKNFLQMNLETSCIPFVTVFRVLVNVKTAISILAVDFPVFPRRYAKTETYGTGVMDFGVGAFILANSLVCPEARRKDAPGSTFSSIFKQLLSVWPLIFLGMARLISVKIAGYHEHVTEYGVHWNFFFTLAIVRVSASILLALFPVSKSWLLAVIIGGLYQIVLEITELKSFIIHDSDRTGGFLSANKEGVFSVIGYIAIYIAGVQVGLYVMQKRTLVKDWIKAICHLLLASFVLWAVLYICQTFVEPVSRRMANLSFCIWTLAQSLFFLSCISIADVVLVFSKMLSSCTLVSSSWNPIQNSKPEAQLAEEKIKEKIEGVCLIQAVNRNQLLFFLLANIMTGLTNVMVDTVNSNDFFSVCVLLLYMFMNCSIILILHLKKITVKFW